MSACAAAHGVPLAQRTAVEHAECKARCSAACAAANAAGLPAPFCGPAADSALGEALLCVLPIAFRHGYALELHRMRGLCGLTLRERAAPSGAVATQYGGGVLVERRAADGVRVVRLPWATLYTRERVDERGFRGGPANLMAHALKAQAPWLRTARRAPRKIAVMRGWFGAVDRTTSLMRAADEGDERRVRELLAAGALPSCVDSERRAALHYASQQGDARNVAALLEADAESIMLDAQDNAGRTPLIMASKCGLEGAVRVLLARGAWQELKDSRGEAALHHAARSSHAGVAELLCAAPGAATALALRDGKGCTPLALACSFDVACAAVLRSRLTLFERARVAAASAAERGECKARCFAACAAAETAGLPAPFCGPAADSPLGEALLNVLPIAFRHGYALELHHVRGLCGLTLRERAVPGGVVATPYGGGELVERRAADSVRVVRLAWATLYTRERVDERGFRGGPADVMARTLKAQAPWLRAARRARRQSADMQGQGWVDRTTSLMRAASAGDERRVRELLATGAPLSCVDGKRMTALHYASQGVDARTVVALLEADAEGKSLDAQDGTGRTPLIMASMGGHKGASCEGAARELLARGARQELQDIYGRAALHMSAEYGQADIIELLCAAQCGPPVDVDVQDKDGRTALIIASVSGREGAVRALLAGGARQELQDSRGEAALHVAAEFGHADIVELLCAAPGLQVDAQNLLGDTPLVLATGNLSGKNEGNVRAVVRALLARGARQEVRGRDGKTALHKAASRGLASIIELLCAAPGAAAALTQRDFSGRTPLDAALGEPLSFRVTLAGQAACAAVLRAHGAS
jgi:ankyrin repeat protein